MEIFGITDTKYTKARKLEYEPRHLKRLVQDFNAGYGISSNGWYIRSSQYGYRLTRDIDEISADLDRRERNAKKVLKRLAPQRRAVEKSKKKKLMGGLV